MNTSTDFAGSQVRGDTQWSCAAGGSNIPDIQPIADTQTACDVGDTDFANGQAGHDTHNCTAIGEPTSPNGQAVLDTHDFRAVGRPDFRDRHIEFDTQRTRAVSDQVTPTPTDRAIPKYASVSGPNFQDSHSLSDAHVQGAVLDNPLLGVLAETVDDLEKVRCATENRLRALTDTSERGHGLTLHNPDVARLAALCDSLKAAEHQAILNMRRVMRAHPLWEWAKPIAGVGEKQFARLLAVIGDPAWNDLHNRPRKVSELWAFTGYHVIRPVTDQVPCDTQPKSVGDGADPKTSGSQPSFDTQSRRAAGSNGHTIQTHLDTQCPPGGVAPKRRRGQQGNWNGDARKRCFLIAESLMKQRSSPYREVYDNSRTKYEDAVHTEPCVRCGPKGKPAQSGSLLSLGHQHARGLRAVAKTFLRDLWREAARLHKIQTTPTPT